MTRSNPRLVTVLLFALALAVSATTHARKRPSAHHHAGDDGQEPSAAGERAGNADEAEAQPGGGEPSPDPPRQAGADPGSDAEIGPGGDPDEEGPQELDARALEAGGARIGEVIIRAGNVFDPDKPGEKNRLYRWVNRLHRRTRDRVIRRQLLFQPGSSYSGRRIDESARLLRDAHYLYDADIRPVRYEDGVVDVEVHTRDVWSLRVGGGFGRSGGTNSVHFGLEDENFLGLGKALAFRRSSNVDRTSSLFRYTDPNVLGSRVVAEVAYSDNSDGSLRRVIVKRPFYSLDTRWAVGFDAWSDERVDTLYQLGEVSGRFGHREQYGEVWTGFSHGLRNGRTRRWRGGLSFEDDRFTTVDAKGAFNDLAPDRRRVYPWVELESIQDGYIVLRDLDRIERQEDRNLGRRYVVRLGLSSSALGAYRDQALISGSFSSGMRPGDRQLLFFDAAANGWFGSGGTEDATVGGGLRYYIRDFGEHQLFAGVRVDVADNLTPDHQLLLGGDSGLRGYPLRYQDGDRRVLLTLEQRFYTRWHLFKLIRFGAAAFVDFGRCWFAGTGAANRADWLSDVGVGLRLGSSRTSSGSMVHIDLAMPMDAGGSISGLQVLVRTRETF